jgi:hypothetical protein
MLGLEKCQITSRQSHGLDLCFLIPRTSILLKLTLRYVILDWQHGGSIPRLLPWGISLPWIRLLSDALLYSQLLDTFKISPLPGHISNPSLSPIHWYVIRPLDKLESHSLLIGFSVSSSHLSVCFTSLNCIYSRHSNALAHHTIIGTCTIIGIKSPLVFTDLVRSTR